MKLSSWWYVLETVLAAIGFALVVWWALKPSNKKKFDESANIVIDTDLEQNRQPDNKE